MLLFQRAIIEGSLSLLMQCSQYIDMMKSFSGDNKETCHLLLELLTPIAKSYPSEMGVLSISQGLQCLGGSGYCDDYPLEQYYRDIRIDPIHEGTTGIQGMDLLGRKVTMKNGQAFKLYLSELEKTISTAKEFVELEEFAQQLSNASIQLQQVTQHLLSIAKTQGPEYFLADATLYLEYFSIVTIAWQWLLQGIAVQKALNKGVKKKDENYYRGKMVTLKYFFEYELIKTLSLAKRLLEGGGLTVKMNTELFND